MNWEVLVVNEPEFDSRYFSGGKIALFTGLFEHYKTDAEIATIIAHQVGAVVARYEAEVITKYYLWHVNFPDPAIKLKALSFRLLVEADCIGLFLMAAAGYDPRVALKVYEKLGKIDSHSSFRSQHMENTTFMEKALALYRNNP